ncbi:MAG: hypothetical protein ABR588_03260 [Sphingomicrobium sp.]|nr:hypothetical protein [Sphingomonadales bacterium]
MIASPLTPILAKLATILTKLLSIAPDFLPRLGSSHARKRGRGHQAQKNQLTHGLLLNMPREPHCGFAQGMNGLIRLNCAGTPRS